MKNTTNSPMLKKLMPMFDVSENAANVIHNISNLTVVIATIVGAAAAIALFWSGGIRERYAEFRLSDNERLTAEAKETAAKANNSAATANERAALLENDAAQARLELERLKERAEPRRLSEEQKRRLHQLLEGVPRGEIQVAITRPPPSEAAEFASQLIAAFDAEGFPVSEVVSPIRLSGLVLTIAGDAPPHARPIEAALRELGFETNTMQRLSEFTKPDVLQVFVGDKE